MPNMFIEKITMGEIIKTLQSPRPWADLKAKANALKPALKLVLAEELKAAVDARLKEGKDFGRKANKQQTQHAPSSIRLQATHVQVPAGLFSANRWHQTVTDYLDADQPTSQRFRSRKYPRSTSFL